MYTEHNKELDLVLIKFDVFVEKYLQSENNEAIAKASKDAEFSEIALEFANELFRTKYKDFKEGDVEICIIDMYRYRYLDEA